MTWLILVAFVAAYACTAFALKVRRHRALNKVRIEVGLETKPFRLRTRANA
jgi:hypothetical protein